jgi:hypothetical protein
MMTSYKKLLMVEFKRNYQQLLNMLLLLGLFVLLINGVIYLVTNEKLKLDTSIGLVVEDSAMEINMLLGSIRNDELSDIITFRETTMGEGKELLEKDEILALIHVEENTFEALESGGSAKISLTVGSREDIRVVFLSNYLENMVEMLNSSQNSAMIYYALLRENGTPYEERISELNRLSRKYVEAFIFRSRIFDEGDVYNKFLGLTAIDYYYHVLLIVLMILASIVYHNKLEEDLRNKVIFRLFNTGYSLHSIYLTKGIISIIYVAMLIIPLKAGYLFLINQLTFLNMIKFIPVYILAVIPIQLMVMTLYILVKNDITRDIVFLLTFSVLGFFGGFAIPLEGLPVLNIIKEYNFLHVILKAFIQRTLEFRNIIAIFLLGVPVAFLFKKEAITYD